jgi:hypothetical protein
MQAVGILFGVVVLLKLWSMASGGQVTFEK